MSNAASKTFTLTDNQSGESFDLPVFDGSVGPSVIDVRRLYGDTGHFTYDPGFTSTGSCDSAITFIDGDEGILLHRGYAIDDLAERADFLEVAYLLLNGELPGGGSASGATGCGEAGAAHRWHQRDDLVAVHAHTTTTNA